MWFIKKSFNKAEKKMFGKEFYNYYEGGSIPFISELGELFSKCEMLVTYILGPGSNSHWICLAAGTGAQILGKEGKYAILRLASGEVRKILLICRATIGTVGNEV